MWLHNHTIYVISVTHRIEATFSGRAMFIVERPGTKKKKKSHKAYLKQWKNRMFLFESPPSPKRIRVQNFKIINSLKSKHLFSSKKKKKEYGEVLLWCICMIERLNYSFVFFDSLKTKKSNSAPGDIIHNSHE